MQIGHMIDENMIEFRKKRQTWMDWLQNDEHHAIWKQITAMAWHDAVFRVLNEARNNIDSDIEVSATNFMLGNFINYGYVATQILAIRRLVDDRKDVISLTRLLKDVRAFRCKLTREIYVCYDDELYGGNIAERRHEVFDKLSGVTPDNRKTSDVMSDKIFDRLDQALNDDSIKEIVAISHKFQAHAADQESRNKVDFSELSPSFDTVSNSHRAITLVAVFIESVIFNTCVFSTVPQPPLGAFKGLNFPYASNSSINKMKQVWRTYSKERESWCNTPYKVISVLASDDTSLPWWKRGM